MPLLADRVQETTSTQGTGSVTLLGAVEGYRTFNSVFANGDVVFYTIDDTFGNWEVGYGAVSTGVLSRTTVLDSSNSNNLVNFPAGTKRVFCVAPKPALLPNQTGSSGKFLTTDGTNPSWATVASGGVNSIAIATNYGFKGTSSGSSSVTLSLQTNVTGILKGNASTGTVTAAAAGTDYAAPTAGTVSQLLANDGSGGFSNVTVSTGLSYNSTTKVLTNASTATVSSVTFTGDGTVLSSTPSTAVTTSGTLTAALKTQTANKVFAGPVGGGAVAPTFRSLVAADIPSLPYAGATTGQTILAGNNIGGFQNVSLSGLSYDTGTHVLSGAAPTSGQSILAGNSSGGFQNVTLSGLSYNTSTSTLSVTSGSSGLVFNVKDYGAVGDNSNDDTSAIRAAIAAASATYGGYNYGGTVYFPSGNYKVTGQLSVDNAAILFVGEGSGASAIIQWTLSSNTISFANTNGAQTCGVNNIAIRYVNGAPTAGSAIVINNSHNVRLQNFDLFTCYIGILIQNTSAIFIENFSISDYGVIGIYCLGPVNDVYVNNFILGAGNGGALGGIRLYGQVEAFTCSNGDILTGTWSMTTDAPSFAIANRPAYNVFSNMYFDSSANGVLLANCVEFDFVGCWFSGGRIDGISGRTAQPGLTLSTSDSMRFANTKFFNCGAEGVVIGSSAVRANFTSCTFQSNSKSSSGTYSGIRFVTGTNDFQVLGCMGNNVLYGGLQNYALKIDSGCNNFIVANNNFRGTGGGISNAAGTSGTQIVSQNLG